MFIAEHQRHPNMLEANHERGPMKDAILRNSKKILLILLILISFWLLHAIDLEKSRCAL
jgi:hypothetical protein